MECEFEGKLTIEACKNEEIVDFRKCYIHLHGI